MINFKEYTTDGKVVHHSVGEDINEKLSNIIGDNFIEYRKQWDLANKLELTTDFPLFLQLDMNQRCNFRCPHCIIGNKKMTHKYYSGTHLSWEKYMKIVKEGAEHNCPSISVQGNNEPLLNKNIEKYISFARKHGFIDIMINTNASLLTEKRAKSLLDSGLTRLRFSLDAATEATFNKVRIGGDYKKVVRNILYFIKIKDELNCKLPVTGVSFCKQAANEHEVDIFKNMWSDKVDIVTIQKYVPPVLEPGYDEYYTTDQVDKQFFGGFRCPQPFQRVTIRNSEITPCCSMFSSALKIGDVNNDTIYKAWHSKEMKELRLIHREGKWYKNNICRQCVNLIYPASRKNYL
tara:strand:+ start:435 stop:1478 length:1044 start_codon:yes stop_codon:yes gene_type:complete